MRFETTILVVDDTEDSREITREFLRLKGFAVTEAATGMEGLRLARALPDLIILDVHLPDIDGFEVCRRLRSDPATATIPVLHLSARYRSADDRIRGLEEGADAYLTQPADPDELLGTVKALLRGRGVEPSAGPGPRPRRARPADAARALEAAGHELTGATDVERATGQVLETVRQLFRARRAAFYRPDAESRSLVCIATAGTNDTGRWLVRTLAAREDLAGLAVAEGRPLATADILHDPRVTVPAGVRARLADEECRAVASIPLIASGRTLGAWSLADTTGRAFHPEDLDLLSAFGAQAALALRNAALYEEAGRHLRESQALLAVAQSLGSSADTAEIARRAAREVTRLIGADTSMFFAVDRETRQAVAVAGYHVPKALLHPDFRVALESLPDFFKEVGRSGRPLASADVAGDPRLAFPAIRNLPLKPRSLLCAPVVTEGRVSGALLSYWWTASRQMTDDEMRLAVGVATQLVLALDNARLHAETRRQQEQLAQAQKMDALGQLASGIAHDFNNLLTVIAGRSQSCLARLPASEPLHRELRVIHEIARRAALLTRHLLAFSRKQVIEPHVLDLNAVVMETASMLEHVIGTHVALRHELAVDLGAVRADSGQIEQAILNLVVNARDAMPGGGVVTIRTANVEVSDGERQIPAGRYVVLAVSDTGGGMDEATQARIFEPFFTTKARGRGTGLGLSTVLGIVKQSDGHIVVDSRLGQGTTFALYFPRSVDAVEVEALRPPQPRGGAETVLVVEDAPEVRVFVGEVLGRYGYRVLEAANAVEAHALAERHPEPIQLLLLADIQPRASGVELARRLAARLPALKIVFMPADPDEPLLRDLSGPDGPFILDKPFTPEALAAKVRGALDAPRTHTRT